MTTQNNRFVARRSLSGLSSIPLQIHALYEFACSQDSWHLEVANGP